MIELKDVCFSYSDMIALDHINLSIKTGEALR